jgi:hypothetical protein
MKARRCKDKGGPGRIVVDSSSPEPARGNGESKITANPRLLLLRFEMASVVRENDDPVRIVAARLTGRRHRPADARDGGEQYKLAVGRGRRLSR